MKKNEKISDTTQHMADVMREFKQISNDLKCLYYILYESNCIPGEDFNKVLIAAHYLETKFNFIDEFLKDHSKHLPDELRKELELEAERT